MSQKPNKLLIALLQFTLATTLHVQARGLPEKNTKANRSILFDWAITGRVTTPEGEPLAGVSVQLKGTNITATTTDNGNFSLNVPETGGTILFSHIGYGTIEKTFTGPGAIDAQLALDQGSLDQVIVTGYSTERKKDLTGAVTVVDVKQLNRQPSSQITNQLQGQAAGVTVIGSGQPGQEPSITIRGINTFGNNTPLFVVDGVPVSGIGSLNPNDVASVQVLKDAGAASIYGSRASNGVVIITTKKGAGKIKFQYDGFYGMQVPQSGNVWNTLSPIEMAQLKFMALRNSGVATNDPYYGSGQEPVLPDYLVPVGASEGDPSVDPSLYNVDPFYSEPSALGSFYRIVRANKQGTNWYEEIFDPAPLTSHNISLSGSGNGAKYMMSMNYFNQQGTLKRTGLERYTLRVNTEFNAGKKIRIGENIAFAYANNPAVGINTPDGPIGMAMRSQPIIPVYDIMGNYAGSFGNEIGPARNPVAMLERTRNNKNTSYRIFGNIYGEVDLLKNFIFRTSFGGEHNNYSTNSFTYPEYENAENSARNAYTENAGSGFNWTWTNTLRYSGIFNDVHNLNVLAGTEAYNAGTRMVGGTTLGYFSFDPNYTTLQTGSGGQTAVNTRSFESLYSYFGRLDYSFDERYLFSATIRRDGSSKFLNNTYGWFPAFTAGWRISEEKFMTGISWLDDLKIRGGWGIMGNQLNVDPMNSFTTFASSRFYSFYDITGSNSSIVEGVYRNRLGNPDARWEKNIQSNVGFDATLFKGIIQVTADYYRKDVRDLLFNPAMPGTAGSAAVPFVNIASMKNSGLDLTVSGRANFGSELSMNASLNVTTYTNSIVKVSNLSDYFALDSRRFSDHIVRNEVGRPTGQFFGYKVEGFWDNQEEIDAANQLAKESSGDNSAIYQTDVKVGRFRYADVNGDGRITPDDRTPLGNPNPDFTYGLNLSFEYKSFDLSMFFYGSQGNELWNNLRWWRDFYSAFYGGKSTTALYDSWTPENTNAKAPIQETSASFSTNNVPSSYFVENGSYLRLRNMQIGYTIPSRLAGRAGIQNLRLYVQAANLFTITGYSGLDPEVTGSAVSFGIDEGTYPVHRQYLVGVNLQF